MASFPVDKVRLDSFGARLFGTFGTYKRERRQLEQQWLRNLRQANAIHDPEIKAKMRKTGSNAYPGMTRQHIIETVSSMMELLFPNTEKNWDIRPTPIPELSIEDMQALLADINLLELQMQQPKGKEEVEAAIMEIATQKCDRMRLRITDQLEEMDYVSLARSVLKSGILYGIGLLSGPMVDRATQSSWSRNIEGVWEARESEVLRPIYQIESVWDWYPDLSAKALDGMDGYYFRRVFSRNKLRQLADRPDFMGDRILEWLSKNERGNWVEEEWESDMRSQGDRSALTSLPTRKYQLLERWGLVSGHELAAAGAVISEDELHDEFESCVWMIDSTVIKAVVNPMQRKRRPLHTFIFEESDLSICGIGIPQIDRDSQMAVNEAARMLLDNCSAVCGPNVVVDPAQVLTTDMDIYAFKTWMLDPDRPASQTDPVRELKFDGHIAELVSVIELFKRFGDEETNSSPLSRIQDGGSEALRTEGNMSMALGRGSLPIRDTVRNFDKFTTSFIGSLYDWNMEFGSDLREKGDYQVIPKASQSLMSKEVRARAMDYLIATLKPQEEEHVKWRKMLTERMKVRDLPIEDLLETMETVEQNRAAQIEQQQAILAQQQAESEANVRKILADAMKNVALAKKAGVSADVNVFEALQKALMHDVEIDEAESRIAEAGARTIATLNPPEPKTSTKKETA